MAKETKWSFEWQMTATGKTQVSKQRLDTSEQALREAVKWLSVCAENDCYPAVRVVQVDY